MEVQSVSGAFSTIDARLVIGDGLTNKQRHNALAACANTAELVGKMTRGGRYYKLNLKNLVTGRQPTICFAFVRPWSTILRV